MQDGNDLGQHDPGLSDLINQTAYQNAPALDAVNVDPGQTGVTPGVDSPGSGANGEGLSPAVQNAPAAPPQGQQTGLTPQTPVPTAGNAQSLQQPDPRLLQMEETIRNQARIIDMTRLAAQQEEERRFQQSLEGLDPDERDRALKDRELEKLRAQTRFLTQQQQQVEQQRQMSAKQTLAVMIAGEAGLDPMMADALMTARSVPEMEQRAQLLAQTIQRRYGQPQQAVPQQVQQPVQQQRAQTQYQQGVDPQAVFAAGGESGSSNVTPKVEVGSGDLMGLIQQSQYQAVKAW